MREAVTGHTGACFPMRNPSLLHPYRREGGPGSRKRRSRPTRDIIRNVPARYPLILILALLRATGAGFAAEETGIDRALRELGSPFLETREGAAAVLARAGVKAEDALRKAYPGADYRKKALILNAFIAGRPEQALPLVYSDLSCRDRGVAHAQRRIVSAVYSRAWPIVEREIVPSLPRENYQLEHLVRCAPAPVTRSRQALLGLAGDGVGRARAAASNVLELVAEADEMRTRLREMRDATDPVTAEGAREMLRRIWTHDVERVFLAVVEGRGREGTYDGMFDLVGELDCDPTFRPATVLLRIIRDEPMPDGGVPVSSDRPYTFLEEQRNDPMEIRNLAALCLGDIGSDMDGAEMAGYFVELPPLSVTGLWKNPKESLAQACSMLGEDLPLRFLVAEYLESMDDPLGVYIRRSLLCSRLGMGYARLGDVGLSRQHFRESMRLDYSTDSLTPYNLACALTRLGHLDEALDALRESKELGYGSERGHIDWMERDRDLEALWETEGFRRLRDSMRAALER